MRFTTIVQFQLNHFVLWLLWWFYRSKISQIACKFRILSRKNRCVCTFSTVFILNFCFKLQIGSIERGKIRHSFSFEIFAVLFTFPNSWNLLTKWTRWENPENYVKHSFVKSKHNYVHSQITKKLVEKIWYRIKCKKYMYVITYRSF